MSNTTTLQLCPSEAVTLSSVLDRELGSILRALDECHDGQTPATERADAADVALGLPD